MKKILLSLLLISVLPLTAYGFGVGYVTHPLLPKKRLIAADFAGNFSSGGGIGVQASYTSKINRDATFDFGMGMSGGERSSRLFAGLDYEFFPDYGNQPRISMKISLENTKEFNQRFNTISFTPTFSKGFNFWGQEAYPFVALPFGVALNDDTNVYETTVNLNLGATTRLPFEGYTNLTAKFEATVGIKDSWTGAFLGLSLPIN